ncbi:uncharacterized protein BDV14DRAFT_186184 [Aspergillus stella-maris]|uniref:uncharacterized protein n=1 Tax=Aspergillus stella-maris TaxID=1810926 RepID=UPI003CCCFA3B
MSTTLSGVTDIARAAIHAVTTSELLNTVKFAVTDKAATILHTGSSGLVDDLRILVWMDQENSLRGSVSQTCKAALAVSESTNFVTAHPGDDIRDNHTGLPIRFVEPIRFIEPGLNGHAAATSDDVVHSNGVPFISPVHALVETIIDCPWLPEAQVDAAVGEAENLCNVALRSQNQPTRNGQLTLTEHQYIAILWNLDRFTRLSAFPSLHWFYLFRLV